MKLKNKQNLIYNHIFINILSKYYDFVKIFSWKPSQFEPGDEESCFYKNIIYDGMRDWFWTNPIKDEVGTEKFLSSKVKISVTNNFDFRKMFLNESWWKSTTYIKFLK